MLAVVRQSQKFSPRHRPTCWGAGRPKFNQLEMVTTLRTNPVWWGSMHTISSYCANRPIHTQTHIHRQDRLQYTVPQLACSVSRPLSTPAADAYDQLHAVTSSSQPQKRSATALVASPSQDQLRGTRCRHHSVMTNCLSLHFADYSRLNFLPEQLTTLL